MYALDAVCRVNSLFPAQFIAIKIGEGCTWQDYYSDAVYPHPQKAYFTFWP